MQLNKNQKRALIGTAGFHVLLFICFLIMGLSVPLPLPEEEGVEVNLGNSTEGMGATQPSQVAAIQPQPSPSPQQTNPQPSQTSSEQVATQETTEVPALEQNSQETTEETTEETQEQTQQVDMNALYRRNTNTNTTGGNEGQTGNPGDQGVANGTPDAANYSGVGGNGINVGGKLRGRVRDLKKPAYDSKKEGIVVVEVSIDESGNVISARGGVKGSTTNDQTLINRAEEAARKSKYSAAGMAVKGTITYHFQKN